MQLTLHKNNKVYINAQRGVGNSSENRSVRERVAQYKRLHPLGFSCVLGKFERQKAAQRRAKNVHLPAGDVGNRQREGSSAGGAQTRELASWVGTGRRGGV